ncbi:sensor histidine kinase, partial [Achromobacter xylosoxidans]
MQLDPSLKFLPDQGEVARHLRQLDWDSTSIGPPALWPQNLRTALSLCLSSRFPILLWWGEDFSVLYNDAYVPFLGAHKHPAALGRPGQECWSEIWPEIGPMLAGVYRSGQATWSYDEEYYFDRHLPREEVYVTFTYGPILAADGVTVQGVFCPCTETTEKIVSARRLETLRELGAQPVPAAGPAATAGRICDVLARNPRDVPFCLIYRCGDPDFELLAATGVNAQSRPAAHWPLAAVAGNGEPQTVALASLGLALPGGPWPDLAAWARILPLRWTADGSVSGVMVLGVSARRPLDSAYCDFLDLVAQHSASAIASAVAYEQEARRAEVLAELDRAKTIFFSNVSHEFRTPLTLILGPLQQALAQPSAGLERETLELLLRNALRLQKLVNSLLDFSRIEGGGMVARLQPTDLARATQEHASAFRSAMESAGLALSVQCDAVPTVLIDRDWYERIVLNLLSNAFKYTLRGSIDVALRDSGDEVVLSVRDTGVGIARSDLANIFQRFHRGQSPAARSHEGSGIGLALVRELVKLLGGAISVDSEPGVGSVFTVTLPKKQ